MTDFWRKHGVNHGDRPITEGCSQCAEDVAEMMSVRPDIGPWVVNVWPARDSKPEQVVLQSDDFRHDVALVVTGDFWGIEQKKAYAQLLADGLNSLPGVRPLNWLQLEREKQR